MSPLAPMLIAGIVCGFLAAALVFASGWGWGWIILAYIIGGDIGLIATGLLATRAMDGPGAAAN